MSKRQTKSYRVVAGEISFKHEQEQKIFNTFFAVSDYYKMHPNSGACHLISSIFHVLLSEQNIANELCIGEVKKGNQFFDHSWIEIDGKIFDIGIQATLDGGKNDPIYANQDLYTELNVENNYGVESPSGFDTDAKRILKTPFVKYMDEYPQFREGAWKIVKDISKKIRLKLSVSDLRQKYKTTERIVKI
ncbi:hypothetical protein FO441_08070 [Salinicoccus cyprini]|uniref:Microcin J25-processing protein McjB C-terminal domain-containing protein n=1 Tax=Salinicoccus cyprini TaxID=2493691 RepID=A0A558ATR8_9STAP|nr:lasso peptide biosynthesis protein [Salinicoccus cyprini]TVT27655.1 hypothetical protein FO441_08070 [Salinicoccus cyprini]